MARCLFPSPSPSAFVSAGDVFSDLTRIKKAFHQDLYCHAASPSAIWETLHPRYDLLKGEIWLPFYSIFFLFFLLLCVFFFNVPNKESSFSEDDIRSLLRCHSQAMSLPGWQTKSFFFPSSVPCHIFLYFHVI